MPQSRPETAPHHDQPQVAPRTAIRAALALAALACAATPVCLAAVPPTLFRVTGEVSTEDRLRYLETAQQRAALAANRLGLDLQRPVNVVLFDTHRDFVKAMGSEVSALAVGLATGDGNTIYVDASGAFTDAGEALGHEIVHAILAQGLKAQVAQLPLWFHEGLAQVAAEQALQSADRLLKNVALTGSLISLEELRKTFPTDSENAGLAYLEGKSAVTMMLEEGGWENIAALLAEVQRGLDFSLAMRKVTGENLAQFEKRWKGEVGAVYPRVRADWMVDLLIWGVMAAALVWAAWTIRRRQRSKALQIDDQIGE